MTNRELIRLLVQNPPDMEVFMEVKGQQGLATDVDWESGGVSTWLVITDYPLEKSEKTSTS